MGVEDEIATRLVGLHGDLEVFQRRRAGLVDHGD